MILRWHLQDGHIAIPGSHNKKHIQENVDIFDFELSTEDMNAINSLDEGYNASITGVPENTTYLDFK